MRLPHHHNFTGQLGFSIVELIVVIIIIAIVGTFALMQRGTANEQFQRQNVARELKTAFERARFDSVKRRADIVDSQAKVVVNNTSFMLWTDKDMDGTPEAGEVTSTNFAAQNITITPYDNAVTLPITVTYNQRGEPTATDGSVNINPVFLVCNGACTADNDTTANANIVLVTPTGTVNLMGGGTTIPSFSPPGGLSAVNSSTGINNLAAVTPTP